MPIDVSAQKHRRAALVFVMSVSLSVCQLVSAAQPAAAEEPDLPAQLYDLVMDAQGDTALEMVMAQAQALGGWAPAPGDVAVYDPELAEGIGGAVRFIDGGPVDCVNPKIARLMEDCLIDYTLKENWVRLGRAMFIMGIENGTPAPQPVFDDLLATYIEEVGHSWQEYLHETDGLGSGPRLHPTAWEDGKYYQVGWEYQIKRYVLSLDGDLLTLSAEARARLRGDICDEDGYANPSRGPIPVYDAPTGWPHADHWPTVAPAPGEWQSFCTGF